MPRTRQNKIERADIKVAEEVADWRHHPLVAALATASKAADQPPLYTFAAATCALGLARGNGRMARAGARMLAAEWLATRAKSFVKRRVDRTRPKAAQEDGYRMERGRSRAKPLSSFPSGHTAGAVAVAIAFGSEYPRYRPAALIAAGAAAAVQVPRRTHFPTDIVAGAAIGIVAGWLVRRRR